MRKTTKPMEIITEVNDTYSMFMDKKTQYCQDVSASQLDL
jgi:hypothetical protein